MLKTLGWSLAAILLLCVNLTIFAEWILNSAAISPLIDDLCQSKLNADITVKDARFTILSTFPQAEIRLNGLTVVSHSLDNLPGAELRYLPASRDTLVSDGTLAIGLSVRTLLTHNIYIPYIALRNAHVNPIVVNEKVNNFDILKKEPPHRSRLKVRLGYFQLNDTKVRLLALPISPTPLEAVISTSLSLEALPKIELRDFAIAMDGLNMQLAGQMNPAETDPLITGKVKADIDVTALPPSLVRLVPGHYQGRVKVDLAARLRPSHFSAMGFRKIQASGTLDIQSPIVSLPKIKMKIDGTRLNLTFGDGQADLDHLSSPLRAQLRVDTTHLAIGKFGLGLDHIDLKAQSPDTIPIVKGEKIAPLAAQLTGREINVLLTNGARMLTHEAKVNATMRGDAPTISGHAECGEFSFLRGDVRVNLFKGHAYFNTHPRHKHASSAAHTHPIDSATSLVEVEMSPAISDLVHNWDTFGTMLADSGKVLIPDNPLSTTLGRMSIAFSHRGIVVNRLSILCGRSDMSIRGKISNDSTGNFLADLNLSGRLLDITQLQQAMATASASAAKKHTPGAACAPSKPEHHMIAIVLYRPHTKAYLLPANVDANIHFDYAKAQCGSVPLTSFAGDAVLNRGSLTLHDVQASTPYGHLLANATYDAETADSLRFDITTRVSGIDLSQLHSFIPLSQVLDPYIRNLRGTVSAALHFDGALSPDMKLDPESFRAQMNVSCPDLSFSSSPTLHRLERWLLFRGRQPDHVRGIDVNVSIANRWITLWPTLIAFDRYRLAAMGKADFDGNYNFHIDVEKSIVPWRFGINIDGNVSGKPAITLAGHTFKPKSFEDHKHHFNLFDSLNELLMHLDRH